MLLDLLSCVLGDTDVCAHVLAFLHPASAIVACPDVRFPRSKPTRRLEMDLFKIYRLWKKCNSPVGMSLHRNYSGTRLQGLQIFSRPKLGQVSAIFLLSRPPCAPEDTCPVLHYLIRLVRTSFPASRSSDASVYFDNDLRLHVSTLVVAHHDD